VSRYVPWIVVLVVVYGALRFAAARSVFYPLKYPGGLWDMQRELGAVDVWLNTADGVRLHAWWVERPGARWATLYLHGNAGNVTYRFPQFREIPAAGSSILMPDYRGYGKSSGRPSEKGLYIDADAAYEHLLRAGYSPDRIILHGESLGTAVAVQLASRRPCAAVILEAPFPSARDVAANLIPVLGPLLISGLDSRRLIGGVHVPLLFIQGDRDEVIPLRLGQALFAAAPEPKSFWVIPGAGHNDIIETAGPAYRQRLQAFYEGLRGSAIVRADEQ